MDLEKNITIRSWAEEDRPREKLLLKGRKSLTNAELIAIIIGSGSRNESAVELSKKILGSVNNDLFTLGKLSIKDLQKFKGIGEAKAISIMACLELGTRRKNAEIIDKPKITTSKEAYLHLKDLFYELDHEQFWILLLSRANKIIIKKQISAGGVSGTVVDSKIIFKTALEHLASGIILFHNHPSGNLKPSKADIDITKKLIAAGKLLDINVLDHLIIADTGYVSLVDGGFV